ncbi:hypothetical protein HDU76_011780, partial [Blyttiomyces sp. JEL0837]
MGDYDKAEPLILESLEIRKRISGPNHQATLTCARTLGGVYHEPKKLKQAQEVYVDGWTRLKDFGLDFPETLHMQHHVAQIFLLLEEDYDECEDVISDCMERMERVFGSEHIDTLKAHRIHGTLLNK